MSEMDNDNIDMFNDMASLTNHIQSVFTAQSQLLQQKEEDLALQIDENKKLNVQLLLKDLLIKSLFITSQKIDAEMIKKNSEITQLNKQVNEKDKRIAILTERFNKTYPEESEAINNLALSEQRIQDLKVELESSYEKYGNIKKKSLFLDIEFAVLTDDKTHYKEMLYESESNNINLIEKSKKKDRLIGTLVKKFKNGICDAELVHVIQELENLKEEPDEDAIEGEPESEEIVNEIDVVEEVIEGELEGGEIADEIEFVEEEVIDGDGISYQESEESNLISIISTISEIASVENHNQEEEIPEYNEIDQEGVLNQIETVETKDDLDYIVAVTSKSSPAIMVTAKSEVGGEEPRKKSKGQKKREKKKAKKAAQNLELVKQLDSKQE